MGIVHRVSLLFNEWILILFLEIYNWCHNVSLFSENNISSWYAQGLLHALLDPQDFGHVVTQFVSPKTGQTLKKKKRQMLTFELFRN